MSRLVALRVLSLLAAAGVAGMASASLPASAAPVIDTATARQWVNVRSGPAVTYPSLGNLITGQQVTVTCQAVGGLVNGPGGPTDKWDRIDNGRYVSDSYLAGHTGIAPRCAAPVVPTAEEAAFLALVSGPARQSFAESRIPASVTIAQAILESGWGRGELARTANNHFGIKCNSAGAGTIAAGCGNFPTRECGSAGCYATTASFRVYRSVYDSLRDHAQVLAKPRYAAAFAYSADPDRFAAEIHRAGYATDPEYTRLLTGLMAKYDLYRYDR